MQLRLQFSLAAKHYENINLHHIIIENRIKSADKIEMQMNTKEHQNIKEHLVLRCGALKSKKKFQETHEDSQKMLRNIKERSKPENVTECQGT